jgi:hypothetical protein
MARETKQMTSVVHKLVHIHSGEDRGCTFFGANEIDRQQQKQAAQDCPRQNLPDRNRDWPISSPGNSRPARGRPDHEGGLALSPVPQHTSRLQWRDRAGLSPASTLRLDTVEDRERARTVSSTAAPLPDVAIIDTADFQQVHNDWLGQQHVVEPAPSHPRRSAPLRTAAGHKPPNSPP